MLRREDQLPFHVENAAENDDDADDDRQNQND